MSLSPVSRFGWVPALLGLVVIGTYLTSSFGYFPGPEKLLLVLFFAIGPVAIVGVLGIRERLIASEKSPAADLGAVFLVIAFAFFNLMLVVQQYVRARATELAGDAEGGLSPDAMAQVRELVDYVQQGIDVSFDIFYCLGLLLLSVAMIRHRDFGKVLGLFGAVSAAALLSLNLGAFPWIPTEVGLVDLGPLTGIWWLIVIVQLIRLDRRDARASTA